MSKLHELLTSPQPETKTPLSQKTISVAESLTGGLIASKIVSVPGSSAYFSGGIVAYNLEQKVRLLNVDRVTAEACNCVSATVAKQMAVGVQEAMSTTGAIGTTGYADCGPNGYPEAWICVIWRRKAKVLHVTGLAHFSRNDFRELIAVKALEMLTEEIANDGNSRPFS